MTAAASDAYHQFKERAWSAALAGQMAQALEILDGALAWLGEYGEDWHVDRTLCNRAAVLVETGDTDTVKADLRRILAKHSDSESCFLAAYTLGRAYEVAKDNAKALFYTRIAYRYASEAERRDWLSSSHNQLGNVLLADSKFDEAREEFEQALEALADENPLRRALALDNLGYCHVVQGRYRQGFEAHFRALRLLRRAGARAMQTVVEVSLCFAYLEVDRYRSAIRHAVSALRLSEETGNPEMRKNALFLLGEGFKLAGDPLAARAQFSRLQEEFYPGAEGVADLLLLLNVKRLVNIKA